MSIYTSSKILPYVYKLVSSSGHFYIGVRWANKEPSSSDPYLGSYGKHAKSIFETFPPIKQIIAEFFDKESAQKFELDLIKEEINDPMCLNKMIKTRICLKDTPPWNKGTKGLQKQSAETLAKRFSAEGRRKMSLAKQGKPSWNKGIKMGPHSEESNRKRAIAGKNNPTHNKCSCIKCHRELPYIMLSRHQQGSKCK